MTRLTLQRAIRVGLKQARGQDENGHVDAITTAIEVALAMESESGGPAPAFPDEPVDFPMPGVEIRAPERSDSAALPASPSVTEAPPQGNLIVTPQQAKQEASAPPRPQGRVLRAPEADDPDPEKRKWEIAHLIDQLHKTTPSEIAFIVKVPDRGDVPITVKRNVMAGQGFGAAKVSYKHPDAGDNLEVSQTVFIDDVEIDVDELIYKIRESLRHAYRPRPKQLQSSTPVRFGELSFDSNAPHVDADVLTDQHGRQY